MRSQRIDTASQRRMDVAFYGALTVINRHKKPGEALHDIPAEFLHIAVAVQAPDDVSSQPHYPLIDGDDYGV